jgi:Rod binding domain-containing protein
MSIEPSGLPVTNQAAMPEWVRKGSPELQRDYALGLQFEQMLTQQLAGALTASAGLGGEGSGEEEGGSGSSQTGGGMLSSMLPGALAGGVAQGGGLGLAAELARQMAERTGTTTNVGSTTETSGTQSVTAPLDASGGSEANTTGGSPA